jgi:DNA-binding CsgD family transcriptional regulator
VTQVLCPILVGRGRELDSLSEALETAKAGRGALFVIVGEPGIGKSRLTRDLEDRALVRGMRVLRGRALQGVGVPFRPLGEALRPATEALPSAALKDLEPYRAVLGPFVPEWADEKTPAEAAGFLLIEGVVRLLRRLAQDKGLLLVLEDLHWADPDTLSVLRDLAEKLGSERLLCTCTMRTGYPGPAEDTMAELVARRAATRVSLERLSDEEVSEMARASLELDELPASILEALTRYTEGVPFIIEEMLSAYVAAGGSRRIPEWWVTRRIVEGLPSSYRDLVSERMGRLSPDARRIVSAAAVLGRRFDWTLLGPITELDEVSVRNGLSGAYEAQLLNADENDPPALAFRHALVRETILAQLLPPDRVELCRRTADAIEDAHPSLPGEWCELAADLREQAGDALGACRLLQESARRALNRGALATAELALQRARALAGDDYMAWMGVDELLIEVLSRAGKTAGLVETGRRLLSGFDHYYSLGGFVSSRFAQLHLNVARAGLLSGDRDLARDYLARAEDLATRALPDPKLEARSRILRAQVALEEGDLRAADDHSTRAVTAASFASAARIESEALDVSGWAALHSANVERAVEAFEKEHALAAREDLPLARIAAELGLGTIDRRYRADPSRLSEARRLALAAGAVAAVARIDLEIARAYLDLAMLDRAAESLAHALDAARRFGLKLLPDVFVAQATLAALDNDPRRMDAMVASATEAGGDFERLAGAIAINGRAILAMVRDQRDAALRLLDAAGDDPGWLALTHGWWVAGLRRLLETIAGRDMSPLPTGLDPVGRAYLGYAAAIVAGRDGRHGEAGTNFEEAAALMPEGWRRQHAHRLVAMAALEDGWGDPAAWATDALRFFERNGLKTMADACKSVLRRAGVRVSRRGRGESEVPHSLRALGITSREVDVLRLVGDGLSNSEIGTRLFVSPRTVETHVASLMRKTGLESRTQLVAFAARELAQPTG